MLRKEILDLFLAFAPSLVPSSCTLCCCIALFYWLNDCFPTGSVAGVVYYFFAQGIKRFKIDDPLDATGVHLACGLWGILSIGLFANKSDTCAARYVSCATDYGLFYGGGIRQLGIQLLGAFAILLWSLVTSGIVFYSLNKLGMLRVSWEDEERGLDVSHHGGAAYNFQHKSVKQDIAVAPAPL